MIKIQKPQIGGSYISYVKVRAPFLLLFLVFLVLGVYYPSIFGEINSVDDRALVTRLLNLGPIDLWKTFFPQGGRYYFRPLVQISFYLDQALFFCQPQILHLENILIHCLNTLLVFFLARRLLYRSRQEGDGIIPLLAALFFGLHPLCTEPVNWISGRTDLLATFFVLLAFHVLVSNGSHFKWWRQILSALFLLLGLLSKEVAAGMFLLVIVALLWPESPIYVLGWKDRITRSLPFAGATVAYTWMRFGVHVARDRGLVSALQGAHGATGIPYIVKAKGMITALGFYAKKILWPFPLNFAIVEINRVFYFALGILTLMVFIWLIWRKRNAVTYFLLWVIIFVLPALFVAANRMAWTPLAERYLYTSLGGLSIAIGIVLSRAKKHIHRAAFAVCLLVVFFGWQTASRNVVWQKNLTLFEDVVKKSPRFAPGHNEYAIALLSEGRQEEARRHFELASTLAGVASYRALAKANYAGLTSSRSFEEVVESYLDSGNLPRKLRKSFLRKLARDLDNRLIKAHDETERLELLQKALEVQERLYRETKNPFHLYRKGQLYLGLGDKASARECFGLACKKSHDYYTRPACELYRKLSQVP